MLLSQKLAGFGKGDADQLRKAMGKKQKAVLDKMKDRFMEGALAGGYPADKLEKIWSDWESFAEYAFNKSHSTCYAFVAFQTAYLKAHYPAEYMAAVLTHNLGSIDKITFFMEECRRMHIPVLGPDVNESRFDFSVNARGQIRFGLGAVKGVGEAAVQAIVEERDANGPFSDIFDLAARVSQRSVNKRTLESLVRAGALDSFGSFHRAQYLTADNGNATGLDKVLRFAAGQNEARQRNQQSLFDDAPAGAAEPLPDLPSVEPWPVLEKLRHEKDVIGFYVSGHPLDLFRYELKTFCTHAVRDIADEQVWKKLSHKGPFTFAGMVTRVQHRTGKTGKRYALFTLEDLTGSVELALWNEKKYLEYEKYLKEELFLLVRAVTQTRFNSDTQYEISIQDLRLLSDAGQEMAKSVTLITPARAVNEQWLQRIGTLVKAHPGKIPVKITLRDEQLKSEVKTDSRKVRVDFNKELFEQLEAIEDLELRIN
jgi:DNA polymerase-3 subunit alpha